MKPGGKSRAGLGLLTGALYLALACGRGEPPPASPEIAPPVTPADPSATATPTPATLPDPDLSAVDPQVRRQLSDIRRALVDDPPAPGAQAAERLGELAKLYHAYDLPTAADQTYALAEAAYPDDIRWTYYRAMLAQRRGDLDAALELFEGLSEDPRLAAVDERLPMALDWRRGRILRLLNRTEAAERALKRAASRPRLCPAALFELGQAALNDDRPADAVTFFEQVLAIQSQAEQVYFPLGRALRSVGKTDEAERYLKLSAEREKSIGGRVLCSDPLDRALTDLTTGAAAWITRGQHARFAGDARGAVNAFRRAVEAAPDDPVAHQALGKGLVDLGETESAVSSYRRAVELDPDSPFLAHDLVLVMWRAGQAEPAQERLSQLLATHPDFAPARLTAARFARQLGKPARALELLDALLMLRPDQAEAKGERARVLLALGRRQEAVAQMARLLDEHPPGNAAERVRLAGALIPLGDPQSASRHLWAVAADENAAPSARAEAWATLGALALGQGNARQAREHFTTALGLDPTSTTAARGLERLGAATKAE